MAAVIVPLLACGLQWVLWDYLQPYVWFLFYPAVFFSSRVDGLRGGLVATVLSTILVWYFFVPPQFSFAVHSLVTFVTMGMFVGMGVLFALTHEQLRKMDRRAAESLRESHDKFRATLNSITDGLLVLDRNWRYTFFSETGARMIGMRQEDLIGRCVWDLFPAAKGTKFHEYYHRAVETGQPTHFEEDYPAPINKCFECHCYPSPEGLSVYFHDITARKHVERELREQTSLLRTAGRVGRLGGWSVNLADGRVRWSEEVAVIHETPPGFSPSLAEGINFYAPEWREKISAVFGACARDGIPYDEELEIITANGKRVWVRAVGEAIRNQSGKIVEVQGAFQDITQRKRAETDLIQTRNTLLEAQRIAQLGSFEYVAATQTTIWSEEEYRIYGLDPAGPSPAYDEMLARCIHPDDAALLHEIFTKAIQGLATYEFKHRIVRPDGSVRWVHDRAHPYLDAQGKLVRYVGTTLDITTRKQLEEQQAALDAQLRQQQKLESIGTLASGVAHEINNPITGILNYAQLIQDRLPGGSPLTEFTGEIMHETERVATIVRNLLTFARNDKQHHSPARIADIVEAVLSLVSSVLRHDQITLRVNVPADLPPLKCRSQQIQQVIMNLVTNARDALNERYPGHHPDKVLNLDTRLLEKAGRRWIRVTVEDRGTGIPPEVRERIFDPFFTTKEREKGTGLGLSISHGIVKEHHGEWTVESEPGRFTRMHVDLPVDNGWET